MISVRKEIRFEAAHRLENHPGACANLHGHSYRLIVEVGLAQGVELPRDDMVVDFGVISKAMKDINTNLLRAHMAIFRK